MKKTNNFVNGKIISGNSTNYLDVDDPSKGEVISKVILSDQDDYNAVVESRKFIKSVWRLVSNNTFKKIENYF